MVFVRVLTLPYHSVGPCCATKKVRKATVFNMKTVALLVLQSDTEVRATPANTLKILHFYGMDARVSQ